MDYPIVNVKTEDGMLLYGLHLKAKNSKTIIIAIHGTGSNFYENDFMAEIVKVSNQKGVSVLLTNNRGTAVLQSWPKLHGTSLEHFEDCVKDIDAWVSFALSQNYNKIILQGHSLGTEKVVYYMSKGKYNNKVNAVILLAFSDSWGAEMQYQKKRGPLHMASLIKEAENLVKEGKGYQFLVSDWLCYSGVMPKSADSFLNFMQEDSELSKALPFRTKNLPFYRKIKVPILAVIGDQIEYTFIPIKEAIELIKKENSLTEAYQIKNCNHDFKGKEKELAELVSRFLEKIK
ncbi:DUF1749 domain-containing protein [Candidatus Pacearchaeota archaeon]|nr:DUF1749 domain-containing protein [Candidatus Pacearchaeota archaeon]